jgi:hypothetical protein
MSEASAPNPQSDADQLDAAADQAIAACGGDAREAMKALLIANEFLEAELAIKVSHSYTFPNRIFIPSTIRFAQP